MTLTEEGLILTPGLLSRYVRLSTGSKVHYVTAGETGPNVVLLHGGVPGSSGIAGFRLMAPFLAERGFCVYAPDMPSYGLTEDPGNFYGYGQGAHVDFLHDFVNALALDTFHLAGNSMGCTNTVNYTIAHPDRVISFALIAGNIGDLVSREAMRSVDNRDKGPLPGSNGSFDGSAEMMRAMLESIVFDPKSITDDLVEMRTLTANRQAEHYAGNMKRFLNPTDPNESIRLRTTDRLDRLTIPGIYLFGQNDVLYAVEAAHLQEDALPNVQFFYPADTGHQGQTDTPELHNQTFLEFFRDGKVSWETAQLAGISTRRPPLEHVVDTVVQTA